GGRWRLGVGDRAIRAGAAGAVHLRRRVDQEEEERERARRDGGEMQRRRGDALEKLVECRRARSAMSPRATGLADRLDGLERSLAFQPSYHTAERAGEPAHVDVEGDIFPAYAGPGDRDSTRIGGAGVHGNRRA